MRVDESQLVRLSRELLRPCSHAPSQDAGVRVIYEYTYKDLRGGVDWDFINMQHHFQQTLDRGVQYVPYDPSNPRQGSNGAFLFFKTPLSPRSKERGYTADAWYQTIELLDIQEALELEDTQWRDKVMLAIAGDLKVHCTCPAFNWWGYRYILTQLDAAIYPQPIEPDERNPRRRGTICKHLAVVLRVLPFWWTNIAGDWRKQGFEEFGRVAEPEEPEEEPTEEPGDEPQRADQGLNVPPEERTEEE